MSPPRAKFVRASLAWAPLAATCALAPKCLVCLAAYAGLGAYVAAKLGRPEFCSGGITTTGDALGGFAAFAALSLFFALRRFRSAHWANRGARTASRCGLV